MFFFPFADFTLYSFAIINHSYEYNWLLSPVSPPSQPSDLEVILQPMTPEFGNKIYTYRKYENTVFKILDFLFCGKQEVDNFMGYRKMCILME